MLILSRKVGEKIHIGDNVVLEVRRITGTKVEMAVEAPKDIPVHRNEVYDAIQRGEPRKEKENVEAEAM